MTKIIEISYWDVVEGREDDAAEAGNSYKAFADKNLDGTFTWGYVQTGEYAGHAFAMMTWNSGASYGKWQDEYEQNAEYQKWAEAFTGHEDGQPDFMVNREIIHIVA